MRSALWAFLGVIVVLSASCAGGADKGTGAAGAAGMGAGTTAGASAAGTFAGAGGAAGMGATAGASGTSSCGNGVVDTAMGEQCEPSLAVPTSCQALGMGTGMVVCNSTCRLMMMCSGPPNGGGGNGASGGNGG